MLAVFILGDGRYPVKGIPTCPNEHFCFNWAGLKFDDIVYFRGVS